ncbi:brain tumor protein-like [Pollicipes pollicipes]|uniref:brain tumor protein-like n=1 Tax=Pollicipes pollicipes TaxID=41117 RepID=UPI0018854384|nr:brain tumor protein-like [Pollicipes pollicipes]
MATTSRRASGIPQPITPAGSRTPSRLGAMQAQYQQRLTSERQNKHSTLSLGRHDAPESPQPPASTGRTSDYPSPRRAAPASPGSSSTGSAGSVMSSLSASLSMNSSLGPGKVRAMFQARRQGGNSAQGSPVGWDKSYPLEPIQKGTPPEERNRINDEMRRREGELLNKIKGSTKEPAGLQARAPRRDP